MAAIMASDDRADVLRHACRSDAVTRPKARAALASNGNASKSDSACCRCAWRAAHSWSVVATKGPTVRSSRVIAMIAVIDGSAGRRVAAAIVRWDARPW